MRYEKVIKRNNGDEVKIITLISANVFLELGYEIEQFALVKHLNSTEWAAYYHQWSPKSISRKEYMEDHKPTTFLGVVSIGESLKAALEAKELFFSK